MIGTFYDGLTAAPWPAAARIEAGEVVFEAAGAVHRWAVEKLEVERAGEAVRLSAGDDARLVLSAADWRAATGGLKAGARKRRRGRRLVVGLTAAGAALAAVIFVGVPLASGPLARATPPAFERQLGENFLIQLEFGFEPCDGVAGQVALQGLGLRLQAKADTPFDLRLEAVRAPMANAFALPGGAIVVTDKLIAMAGSGDELAAVIAHEVAHVEQRHVMRAVWRNLGLGVVLDVLAGGGGAGQQAVLLAGAATNLSFSRADEAQADRRGMELLDAAGLASTGMAGFFDKVAKAEGAASPALELVSSHPDAARRAVAARAAGRGGDAAFTAAEWSAIKTACAAGPPPDKAAGRRQASLPAAGAE